MLKLKKNQGITLVALVITIIILLILAGVTIKAIFGDNGLIAKAEKAKENQLKAEYDENISMLISEEQMDRIKETKEEPLITSLEKRMLGYKTLGVTKTIKVNELGETKSDDSENNILIVQTKDDYELLIDVNNITGEAIVRDNYFYKIGEMAKITYDANGGTGRMDAQEVRYGFYAKLLDSSFERVNNIFVGWGTKKSNNELIYSKGSSFKVDDDIKLYAQWDRIAVTVKFDPNGGEGDEIDDISVGFNTPTTIPENNLEKEDYHIKGWNTKQDGSGLEFTESVILNKNQVSEDEITLYAQWEECYTITYHANNGTDETYTQMVIPRETVNLIPNTFKNGNLYFECWMVGSNTSNTTYSNKQEVTLTGNIDLYAKWTDSIVAESLLKAIEEYSFSNDTMFEVKINNEKYSIHGYNYDQSLTITQNMTLGTNDDVSHYDEETDEVLDARNMVVLKVNGDLTINSGVTLTAYANEDGYGGPKGMLIYCTGTLTNNGTISMTARGARAVGQNVYLWKNASGSNQYEVVPAKGAAGAARSIGYSTGALGNAGFDGVNRQSGGGGSGGVWSSSTYGTRQSGAGAAGTSYSGGSGGGSCDPGDHHNGAVGGDAEENGGEGGYGSGNPAAVTGGAGNPGGWSTGGRQGGNGTGGLLIIYCNNIYNTSVTSKIESCGSNVDSGYRTGGASGGGSINIFYKNAKKIFGANSAGGKALECGHGGKGSVTIGKISNGTFEKWNNIIEISTKEELESFRNAVNNGITCEGVTIRQTANINLGNTSWTPIGTTDYKNDWENSRPFSGIYDGNGYSITGLNIDTGDWYQGLFGYTDGATIKNLNVEGNVIGRSGCAGIVAYLKDSQITNCTNKANVSNSSYLKKVDNSSTAYVSRFDNWIGMAGGICCATEGNCSITNSINEGEIALCGPYHGNLAWAGGIAAYAYEGTTIQNCKNTKKVYVNAIQSDGSDDYSVRVYWIAIGGIVGYDENMSISKCYNTAEIYGLESAKYHCRVGEYTYVGGIVGNISADEDHESETKISQSWNSGNISGSCTGGVAGGVYSSTVENCYNTGIVTNNYKIGMTDSWNAISGGVVGQCGPGEVKNCYNKGEVRSTAGSSGRNESYPKLPNDTFEGGVIGYIADGGTASNIYNKGVVSSKGDVYNDDHGDMAGGIFGYVCTDGTIENCYNTGRVDQSVSSRVEYGAFGGIIGQLDGYGIFQSFYNIGTIYCASDLWRGGLIGWNNGQWGTTWDKFAWLNTCGVNVAYGNYEEDVEGISTESQIKALVGNKLPSSNWATNANINNGYPYLKCFNDTSIWKIESGKNNGDPYLVANPSLTQ